MPQPAALATNQSANTDRANIKSEQSATPAPEWPDYFPRLGQPDSTTWHYKGYKSDTLRVWRAYYSYVFSHPIKACIGARQFYQSLVYRVFGVATGDRTTVITALATPLLTLTGPILSLIAVSLAKIPRLHRATPPLFQPFTLIGWSNYCCMLQLVFYWHGYRQYQAKIHPLQCLQHSSKSYWNDFFTDNLPAGARGTRLVARFRNGSFSNAIPKRNIIVKPEFGGAGYKLRSFIWNDAMGVYHCKDIERQSCEPELFTPHELRTHIASQQCDFVVEELEVTRDPLPASTLRILTAHFGKHPSLLSAVFLVAPENSISTAYFDIEGYLIDCDRSSIGLPFKYGSKGKYAGIPLPELHEVIATCLSLHEKLAGHLEISWDVLLSEDGPVFLEGNVFPPGCDYKLSIFKNDTNLAFVRKALSNHAGAAPAE